MTDQANQQQPDDAGSTSNAHVPASSVASPAPASVAPSAPGNSSTGVPAGAGKPQQAKPAAPGHTPGHIMPQDANADGIVDTVPADLNRDGVVSPGEAAPVCVVTDDDGNELEVAVLGVKERPRPAPPTAAEFIERMRQRHAAEVDGLKRKAREAIDAERKRAEAIDTDRGILAGTVSGLRNDLDRAEAEVRNWWRKFRHWLAGGLSWSVAAYLFMALYYGQLWWLGPAHGAAQPPAAAAPVDTSALRAAESAARPYIPQRVADQLDAAIDHVEGD